MAFQSSSAAQLLFYCTLFDNPFEHSVTEMVHEIFLNDNISFTGCSPISSMVKKLQTHATLAFIM